MSIGLWYPQLDVYDCVRRMGALLLAYCDAPGLERLYIADFYLANPPLLYRSQMTLVMRRTFGELRVPPPEKTFLTYPAPPLLFKTMEPIQKEATLAMTGKGLLSIEHFQRGIGKLTEHGLQAFGSTLVELLSKDEAELIAFLTRDFVTSGGVGIPELRQSTALRRSVW